MAWSVSTRKHRIILTFLLEAESLLLVSNLEKFFLHANVGWLHARVSHMIVISSAE